MRWTCLPVSLLILTASQYVLWVAAHGGFRQVNGNDGNHPYMLVITANRDDSTRGNGEYDGRGKRTQHAVKHKNTNTEDNMHMNVYRNIIKGLIQAMNAQEVDGMLRRGKLYDDIYKNQENKLKFLEDIEEAKKTIADEKFFEGIFGNYFGGVIYDYLDKNNVSVKYHIN